MDTVLKIIFFFVLSVFGIGLADMAIEPQRQTISAYKKGPISASQFTRIMTGRQEK